MLYNEDMVYLFNLSSTEIDKAIKYKDNNVNSKK